LYSLAETCCPPPLRPLLNRVKSSPIGKRLVYNGFWVTLGTALGKGSAMLATVGLAHVLGREKLGEYNILMSSSMLLTFLAESGLSVTMTKFVPEFLVSDKEKVGRIIGMCYAFSLSVGMLIALFIFAMSSLLCEHVLKAPHLTGLMQFGGILLFLATLSSVQAGLLRGFQDFRGLASTETLLGIMKFLLVVFGAWLDGLRGAMIGYGTALVLGCIVGRWFIGHNTRKHGVHCDFRNAAKELPLVCRFSLPLAYGTALVVIVFWICDVLLVRYVGFSELAIYHAAWQIFMIIITLSTLGVHVFLPLLSETRAKKKRPLFNQILITFFCFNVGLTFAVCLPLLVCPSWFMGTIYGREFFDGGIVLTVLCIAAVLTAVEKVIMIFLIAEEQMWVYTIQRTIWACCYIGGAFTLLRCYELGALGIALAYLFALAVGLFITAVYAWRFSRRMHAACHQNMKQ